VALRASVPTRVQTADRMARTLNLDDIRIRATRRSRVGRRVRRLVPTVVVGSGALMGTGALMAWVGEQPGMHSAVHPTAARVTTEASTPSPSNAQVTAELTMKLRLDNAEVQGLSRALSQLTERRRSEAAAVASANAAASARANAAATAGSAAGGGYSSGGSSTARVQSASASSGEPAASSSLALPSMTPLSPVNVPTIAPISTTGSAAPAVHGTTGASHALP
jgi:hypothetical protein